MEAVAIPADTCAYAVFKYLLEKTALFLHGGDYLFHEIAGKSGHGEEEDGIGFLEVDGDIAKGGNTASPGIHEIEGNGPDQRRVDAHRVGKGVVHRQHEKGPVVGRKLENLYGVVAVHPVIEMSEHDALGIARCAGSVGNSYDIVLSRGFCYVIQLFLHARGGIGHQGAAFGHGLRESRQKFRGDSLFFHRSLGPVYIIIQVDDAQSFILYALESVQYFFQLIVGGENALGFGMVDSERNFVG